jgi:hypothetical protein
MNAQCVATRPAVFDQTLPPHRCKRRATHGEWCRQHAELLGGWRLIAPDAGLAKAIDAEIAVSRIKRDGIAASSVKSPGAAFWNGYIEGIEFTREILSHVEPS